MTITYVNNAETVTNALRYLHINEFNGDIVHAKFFEPEHLGRGDYFRYYLAEQPVVSGFADGETREYTYNCAWYFNKKQFDYKKTFDDLVSERIERQKRLLANNRAYRPSDVYKWHYLIIETQESYYLGDAEDVEDVDIKYSHILCVPEIITITRNDINQ